MKLASLSVQFVDGTILVDKAELEYDDERFGDVYPSHDDEDWLCHEDWNNVKGMDRVGLDTIGVVRDGFLMVLSHKTELYDKMKKELKDLINCGMKEHIGGDFGITKKQVGKIMNKLDQLVWNEHDWID